MARLSQLPEPMRSHVAGLPLPSFEATPFVAGPPLRERRVAIVSTAGLHRRSDPAYLPAAADYRVIPGDVDGRDLVMSHISTNFDRTGFQQDVNVVFPIDRLRELAQSGEIGSVAALHFSFMGATDPQAMSGAAIEVAGMLRNDAVNAVLLVPV